MLDPGTQGVIINLIIGSVTVVIVALVFDFILRSRIPTVFEYRKYLQYVAGGGWKRGLRWPPAVVGVPWLPETVDV